MSNKQILLYALNEPLQIKLLSTFTNKLYISNSQNISKTTFRDLFTPNNIITNLLPHSSFTKTLNKKVLDSFTNKNFDEVITPWYYHTLIRFLENCSGKRVIFQFYPFIDQSVTTDNVARYKK